MSLDDYATEVRSDTGEDTTDALSDALTDAIADGSDATNTQSETKTKQPKLRVKGLQITAKMQYYNYHQAPGFE